MSARSATAPLKLGLLVRRLSTHGGTERFVHGLARHARDQGHAVRVYCAAVDDPVEGVEVEPLRLAARGRVGKLLALDRAARRIDPSDLDLLLGFVRAGHPDLYRAGGGSHRAWMARHRKAFAAVGDAVEARLDDRVLRTARMVVVNSELARRDLQDFSGVRPDRIRLVRNGVDLDRFRPRPEGAAADPRLVGFLGTGFARKGLETALQALRDLPGCRLQVAGSDSRPASWQRLAAKLGVDDRVAFLGPVDRPQDLLPTWSAMILPTRYDPSANAVLEALACGVPVVTSAANGAAEILPEPWLTVPDARDAPAFAAALERALQSTGLGSRCRTTAEAWPAHGAYARMLDLSAELVGQLEGSP